MLDTLIIGMGPAGLSCAIYLKRYGLDALVIGKDLGALELAKDIENYYALGPMSGHDLAMQGMKNALNLGVKINHDEVISIEFAENCFLVKTKKNLYETKTIFIATGKVRNSFNLAKPYEGKGISYCATCDGFFYRNKKIAIVGYNEYMASELDVLYQLTKDITIFTNGNKLETKNKYNLPVVEDKIESFGGEASLNAIICAGKSYFVDGCFIALGSQNAFTLAKHLGLLIENNNLVVDDKLMTNIPGIFAGGDVIGGLLQVVKASSDGAIAASFINKYLRS